MDDLGADDHGSFQPTSIGVGMGGSCPSCRAPVDLGQEFCLECGAPIRFSPRTRRPQRRPGASQGTEPRAQPPLRSGFPWVPFLVVLALIGGGLVLALVGGDDGRDSSSSAKTEEPLPSIKSSIPETDSPTPTQTLQDCDPLQPLDGSGAPAADAADGAGAGDEPVDPLAQGGDSAQPGVVDGSSEQIPELGDGSAEQPVDGFGDPASGVPSTDPAGGDSPEAVTVDQDGNVCAADDGTDAPTGSPTDGQTEPPVGETTTTDSPATTTGAGTDANGATASGEWPSGQAGWTVVVAGYATSTANAQSRAQERAADLQEDGFSDGGVLLSDEFKSLCPGFYVAFSGVFDKESEAKARLSELKEKDPSTYVNVYAREVRTEGKPLGSCTPAS